MREIRSYGSVGVSAGNRRHYPAKTEVKAQVEVSETVRKCPKVTGAEWAGCGAYFFINFFRTRCCV